MRLCALNALNVLYIMRSCLNLANLQQMPVADAAQSGHIGPEQIQDPGLDRREDHPIEHTGPHEPSWLAQKKSMDFLRPLIIGSKECRQNVERPCR